MFEQLLKGAVVASFPTYAVYVWSTPFDQTVTVTEATETDSWFGRSYRVTDAKGSEYTLSLSPWCWKPTEEFQKIEVGEVHQLTGHGLGRFPLSRSIHRVTPMVTCPISGTSAPADGVGAEVEVEQSLDVSRELKE